MQSVNGGRVNSNLFIDSRWSIWSCILSFHQFLSPLPVGMGMMAQPTYCGGHEARRKEKKEEDTRNKHENVFIVEKREHQKL